MSDLSMTTVSQGRRFPIWSVGCLWGLLAAALAQLAAPSASAQTVSAGQFSFIADFFYTTEAQGAAIITVVRANGTDGRVRVAWQTVDVAGTCGDTNSPIAVPGCDYLSMTGELVFDDFETSRRFWI